MIGQTRSSVGADSLLTIDIDAIVANWKALDARSSNFTETAGVVKADAYGLGADLVGPRLAAAGCQTFFVMSLAEAVSLRICLNESGHMAVRILTLSGCHSGQEDEFNHHGIMPVINSLEQAGRLDMAAREAGMKITAALHFDTGMSRLGLDAQETEWIIDRTLNDRNAFAGLNIQTIMSHLTSAEDVEDRSNQSQLERFQKIRTFFPESNASFANSGGILLGTEFHMDLTRPGIALYGLHPADTNDEIGVGADAGLLTPAVRWQARILQLRSVCAGDRVGYNGTHQMPHDGTIMTLGVGYADGYPRALGNRAKVVINGHEAPVVGRVSMDSITVDVTHIPTSVLEQADLVTVLGDSYPLARMAADAGTIGYEILTQLGRRPARQFLTA